MRRISRIVTVILILMLSMTLVPVSADTFEFDPSGATKNPFYPRGYMIEKNGRAYWLSSLFETSGSVTTYSGSRNGLDYIDAEQAGTIYALTDRNPTPGKQYLSAYKNGEPIGNFSSYIGTLSRANIQTTGKSTGWKIPVDMKLEPGCSYEFAFLRGMKANNGLTLVFSEDGRGYIWNPSTSAERAKYDRDKYNEYEFIVSYEKDRDPETNENHYFNFYMVPMRFRIQTYADMSVWDKAADKAETFLDSVSETDLQQGRYKRSNIEALRDLLKSLDRKASTTVRKELQPEADRTIAEMVRELNAMLDMAKSDKPEPSDLTKLRKTLEEARQLYSRASVNTGTDKGQYGAYEVENLGIEIDAAEKMDRFTPQADVNDEVDALEAAMMEVKKSRIMGDMMRFYDKATGITVTAPADSLPDDAEFFVRRFGSGSGEYSAMKKNLSGSETESAYYRIQFYQDEFEIKPSESVEVQIPVDRKMSSRNSTVYQAGSDGSLKKIKSVSSDGMRIFHSRSLGDIVVAGSTATAEEMSQTQSDRMRNVMKQTRDDSRDNKELELAKEKKKKEEYKDPVSKMLVRSANNAEFSSDVKRETDPVMLIFAAAALAVVAVMLGIRGAVDIRRSRRDGQL